MRMRMCLRTLHQPYLRGNDTVRTFMLDDRAISVAGILFNNYSRLIGLPRHFHIITGRWQLELRGETTITHFILEPHQ